VFLEPTLNVPSNRPDPASDHPDGWSLTANQRAAENLLRFLEKG
jgi:hypothetical protein